uniref:Histone H2A n=1 Tax=Giardia intestinalis TaxID=5741 RepID=UPI001CA46E33|nr:Chain C, Histone H2A [Giardia intestinalis]7D69_G Chain G, Histone H2A [Giardia intestinalis]
GSHMSTKPVKDNSKMKSRSARAGISFPIGRIHRHLREGRYAERISSDAPVYLAAVLENVVAEVFREACNHRDKKSQKRIVPNHILTALRKDKELATIFANVTIREGGVARSAKEGREGKGSHRSQDL